MAYPEASYHLSSRNPDHHLPNDSAWLHQQPYTSVPLRQGTMHDIWDGSQKQDVSQMMVQQSYRDRYRVASQNILNETWQQHGPETYNSDQHAVANAHIAPDQEDVGGLRSIRELPLVFQGLFHFKYFNSVQSDCFDCAFNTDRNMVVAAPTGSGKTGVMELALMRLLCRSVSSSHTAVLDAKAPGNGKAVYLAPMKALVQEKAKDWQNRYGGVGAVVLELTGDYEPDKSKLEAADIICTTPEKLDSCTRKLNESGAASFFGDVSLVMIDEVHMLGDPERGSALEAGVVSRIKTVSQWPSMQQSPISKVRFVAVSATIPNVQDIAAWLGAPLDGGLHVYGEEMRPCKLRTIVKPYAPSKNDFLFERRLNEHLMTIIQEHSQGKPALVFCSSRKGSVESALHVVRQASAPPGRPGSFVRDSAHAARLRTAAGRATAKQLKSVLEAGIGFHHAALDPPDRELIEQLFLAQDLPVLCATATLALGVNLPAHLVIVKGTRRYCGTEGNATTQLSTGTYKEYDKSVVLQMVGRAGRPQFDKEGVAVIMTQREMAARYQNLMLGAEEVESALKERFCEHLNAEIVLQTITDVTQAIQWLRTTFLFIRMQRKPLQYGVPASIIATCARAGQTTALEDYLRDTLVLNNVRTLAQHGLVTTDEDGFSLAPAEPGKIMAHYCIALNTMVHVMQIPACAGMPTLLATVAKAAELSHIRLRRGEKKLLSDLHAAPQEQGGPKYPLPGVNGKQKDKIVNAEEKLYVLMNEALSDAPCERMEYSMRQEQEQAVKLAERVSCAMTKYYMHRGSFAAACNAIQLQKGLRHRMWPSTSQQCRQLDNVGRLTAARLAEKGLGNLRALAVADARHIEAAAQRFFPFGDTLKRQLQANLPPLVTFTLLGKRKLTDGMEVQLQLERQGGNNNDTANVKAVTYARLLIGSCSDDKILVNQSLIVETFASPYQVESLDRAGMLSNLQNTGASLDISQLSQMPVSSHDSHQQSKYVVASRHAGLGKVTVTIALPAVVASSSSSNSNSCRIVACLFMDQMVGLDVVQSFDLLNQASPLATTGQAPAMEDTTTLTIANNSNTNDNESLTSSQANKLKQIRVGKRATMTEGNGIEQQSGQDDNKENKQPKIAACWLPPKPTTAGSSQVPMPGLTSNRFTLPAFGKQQAVTSTKPVVLGDSKHAVKQSQLGQTKLQGHLAHEQTAQQSVAEPQSTDIAPDDMPADSGIPRFRTLGLPTDCAPAAKVAPCTVVASMNVLGGSVNSAVRSRWAAFTAQTPEAMTRVGQAAGHKPNAALTTMLLAVDHTASKTAEVQGHTQLDLAVNDDISRTVHEAEDAVRLSTVAHHNNSDILQKTTRPTADSEHNNIINLATEKPSIEYQSSGKDAGGQHGAITNAITMAGTSSSSHGSSTSGGGDNDQEQDMHNYRAQGGHPGGVFTAKSTHHSGMPSSKTVTAGSLSQAMGMAQALLQTPPSTPSIPSTVARSSYGMNFQQLTPAIGYNKTLHAPGLQSDILQATPRLAKADQPQLLQQNRLQQNSEKKSLLQQKLLGGSKRGQEPLDMLQALKAKRVRVNDSLSQGNKPFSGLTQMFSPTLHTNGSTSPLRTSQPFGKCIAGQRENSDAGVGLSGELQESAPRSCVSGLTHATTTLASHVGNEVLTSIKNDKASTQREAAKLQLPPHQHRTASPAIATVHTTQCTSRQNHSKATAQPSNLGLLDQLLGFGDPHHNNNTLHNTASKQHVQPGPAVPVAGSQPSHANPSNPESSKVTVSVEPGSSVPLMGSVFDLFL